MNLTLPSVKLLILQSFVRICFASFPIDQLKSNETSQQLVQTMSEVIETCYKTRIDAIGISGNSPDTLISVLSNAKFPVSLISLDKATRMVNAEPVPRILRHKFQFFVIMASSSMELERFLKEIKNSRWWNHMANFYIIDWPPSVDGCSRAHEILSTAWRMNLLEAKFICVDGPSRAMIYSFNPYTSDAPKPWELSKIYRGQNDHPWSLLVREYSNNRNLCENIDFDKTNDLGGYGISVTIWQRGFVLANINDTGVKSFGGVFGHFVQKIFTTMNATVAEALIHDSDETLGIVDHNGRANGILAEVVNGISDIGFMQMNALTVANASSTYRFVKSGVSVMTQYRGYKSQLDKLASVLDYSSRFGVLLVIIVTIIFMKYFLGHDLSTAILDTMRLICNLCLVKLPTTKGARIYLSSLFIFIVTIVGIYQSQWASMLTKQIPLPDINSMAELAKSGYTIYGNHRYEKFFRDKVFDGRYVSIDVLNCTGYVLQYPKSAACVGFLTDLINDASQFKLHLSKDFVIDVNVVFVIRDDWPLEDKINVLLQRFVDSNLFEYTWFREREKSLRTIDNNRNGDNEANARVLTIDDLSFSFWILAIGLGFATLCFIIEIIIYRRVEQSRNAGIPILLRR